MWRVLAGSNMPLKAQHQPEVTYVFTEEAKLPVTLQEALSEAQQQSMVVVFKVACALLFGIVLSSVLVPLLSSVVKIIVPAFAGVDKYMTLGRQAAQTWPIGNSWGPFDVLFDKVYVAGRVLASERLAAMHLTMALLGVI